MGKAPGREHLPAGPRLDAGNGGDNSNGTTSGRSVAFARGRHALRLDGVPDGAKLKSHRERAILHEAARDLRVGESAVKVAAIPALSRLKNRIIVPSLVEAFEDRSEPVRSECLNALSDLREPSAAGLFKSALSNDESTRVRLAAVRGIYRLRGIESAPAIVKALDDSHASIRRRAAVCLGWLGAESDAPSLLPLFRDKSPEVRAAAVEAAGALRFRSAILGLIKALEDPEPSVRFRANHSLQRITGNSCGTAPANRAASYRKIAKKWLGWWSAT